VVPVPGRYRPGTGKAWAAETQGSHQPTVTLITPQRRRWPLVGALKGGPPMAEPPAAPGGVATAEQDVLLATKLHVPGPRPGFVPRPRLAARLEDGLARGVVLVSAPAGSGKTVLLADWARRGGRPVAWLSLDAADNDPARFWRHLVAALGRARPGTEELAGPALGPLAPSLPDGLVTALINELAGQPGDGEMIVVLDDYHVIDAQQVHGSLLFLLRHLPPGLRLVLAGRSDPPLPLAGLRARGQLAELRADDLRFTADEAAALLREAIGADLPGDAVAALAARTEGWAAGLQLAGLSLRGRADAAGLVAAFSGSHRYVLDYLTEEVLDRQSQQVRAFLLETSVLDRLSGALCDAVTGSSGGQAMLEQVERAGLFLTPLDEVRGWWRYHHLFADLLRARLQHELPARVEALHRAAAAWHEERGLADDAIRHALAAGDPAWAARLIERHFDAVFLQGEGATIQRWLAALPADLTRSRPRLGLAQAWMAVVGGHMETAGIALEAAESASAEAAQVPFEPSAGAGASLLANMPASVAIGQAWLAYLRGDADGMAAFASQARRELADGDKTLNLFYQLELALADRLGGRLDDAERGFASTVAGLRAAGERGLAIAFSHFLGQIQVAQGRLDAALGTYQAALEMAAGPGRPAPPAAGIAYAGMAGVEYQRGELDAALRHVTEGIALLRPASYTSPIATVLATLAWIRQARGDTAGALEAIGEAEQVAPSPAVADLSNPLPAQRARLLLAQGDTAAAARWAQQRGLGADDEPGYPQEREYLVLARVLLAEDRPRRALALLERLLQAAVTQDRTGSVIEVQALRALALAAGGDEPAAVAALAEALTLACPQGYVRVFADEGAPMRALLGRLIAAQRAEQSPARRVPPRCLAQIVQAFGPEPAAPGSGRRAAPAVPGLAEPLTGRELEVLRLLAAGKSNQRIAHDLVVALDTVKKHVTHVLGKLGAANRTEAVARARDLGLIP
jgi:LuxR family transcriptional regulator, maltose regulon positive regulatory protein